MTPEEQLLHHQIKLPPAPPKGGIYKPVVTAGNLIYVSGHGPFLGEGRYITGRVGDDLTLEEGKAAALQVGLAMLATIRSELGSLNRVARVIKLLGMVNSTSDFPDHPKVINGCSELFATIWGEDQGVGARSAVGMGSLPGNIAVEIEAIFELA